MDFWHFYLPAAAAGILAVLYELRRTDCGTEKQRLLPIVYLIAIFVPAVGIAAGIPVVNLCYHTLHLRGGILLPVTLTLLFVLVLLTFLVKALVTRGLRISRRHRVISSGVMLTAYLAELTGFWFLLAASV